MITSITHFLVCNLARNYSSILLWNKAWHMANSINFGKKTFDLKTQTQFCFWIITIIETTKKKHFSIFHYIFTFRNRGTIQICRPYIPSFRNRSTFPIQHLYIPSMSRLNCFMASYNMTTSTLCQFFSICFRIHMGWIDGGSNLLWLSPV